MKDPADSKAAAARPMVMIGNFNFNFFLNFNVSECTFGYGVLGQMLRANWHQFLSKFHDKVQLNGKSGEKLWVRGGTLEHFV